MGVEPLIRFRLDPRRGLPPYRQLADQVRHAVMVGALRPGDRLPSVREVVTQVAINPNTVHRAYRELEQAGVVEARRGQGTFVAAGAAPSLSALRRMELAEAVAQFVARAKAAGLDVEEIRGLVDAALFAIEEVRSR